MEDEGVTKVPQGFCAPAFEPVLDVFVEHFRIHPCGGAPELGASVSVVVDGETVVDLWDGWADADRTRSWEKDTIANVFSCGKGVTAVAVHMLVEDGLLDYDTPIAAYWPEYAANGKEKTTVRHVLTHQAGLPQLRTDLGPGGAWDSVKVAQAIAGATPMWEPGSGHAYHAVTYGHILDELVRRVSGQRLAEVIRQRIDGPLGVDFYVGMTEQEIARCADMTPFPGGPPDSVAMFEQMTGMKLPETFAELSSIDQTGIMAFGNRPNSTLWRTSTDFLAAGGHSNARSLARIYGALARGGEIDGVRLLTPETLAAATELQVDGPDLIMGNPWAWGLGFMLPHPGPSSARFSGHGFGHGGVYGSLGWAEPVTKLGFGYVQNQEWLPMGDPRGSRLLHAAIGCL
jgi:CubicO group peptidase (beta-lactamase class C family)